MDNYLGVFGDSFANTNPRYGGWPDYLAEHLSANLDNHSLYGTSIWWSYKKFLATYKKYTHVAMVYSSPHRWPVLPEWLDSNHWIVDKETLKKTHNISASQREEMSKLISIHKYIFDETLEQFIYQHVFNDMNRICRENNIKLVNVLPFEGENPPSINVDNATGSVLVRLLQASTQEIKEIDRYPELKYFWNNADIRSCHLNNSNNIALAEIIYDAFNKEPCTISVDTHEKFSYNPLELVEMINENSN